ncbi:MAG: hypothetical protein BDTLLHRC_000733 [Candidatus Fervidibacter sp.]
MPIQKTEVDHPLMASPKGCLKGLETALSFSRHIPVIKTDRCRRHQKAAQTQWGRFLPTQRRNFTPNESGGVNGVTAPVTGCPALPTRQTFGTKERTEAESHRFCRAGSDRRCPERAQDTDQSHQTRTPLFICRLIGVHRQRLIPIVGIKQDSGDNLAEVAEANSLPPLLPCLKENGQQKPCQQRQDADDDQKFRQGQGTAHCRHLRISNWGRHRNLRAIREDVLVFGATF